MTTPRPCFLAIEGLDGAGTTTQTERLHAWFEQRGQPCVSTREPTGEPIGRLIRSILRDEPGAPSEESLPWLFAADRSDHVQRLILPNTESGHVVLTDRYLHSSLAYQSLVLPLERVYTLNETFPAPDTTYYLKIPVEVALKRLSARGGVQERFETRERLHRISEAYERVMQFLEARGYRIVTLDADQPIEALTEQIVADLETWWV